MHKDIWIGHKSTLWSININISCMSVRTPGPLYCGMGGFWFEDAQICSLLSPRVSVWDESAVFYHLVLRAPRSMHNAHWWWALTNLMHAFVLCSSIHSTWTYTCIIIVALAQSQCIGRMQYFYTSNSCSSIENGSSAFSLFPFAMALVHRHIYTMSQVWAKPTAVTRDISHSTAHM